MADQPIDIQRLIDEEIQRRIASGRLLDALDTADRLARDLGLPQVRVRIAAARQVAHLRRVS